MIGTPTRFYEVKLENGTSLKFRLTIKAQRKLEEKTGQTYQELMTSLETEGTDATQLLLDFMWAASLPFNPAVTMTDVEDMYDAIVDEGYDTITLNGLLLHILQVSGLYPKDRDIDADLEKRAAMLNAEADAGELEPTEGESVEGETDPK